MVPKWGNPMMELDKENKRTGKQKTKLKTNTGEQKKENKKV